MEAKKMVLRAPKLKSRRNFGTLVGTKFHENWTLELFSFLITFLKV